MNIHTFNLLNPIFYYHDITPSQKHTRICNFPPFYRMLLFQKESTRSYTISRMGKKQHNI